MQTQDSYLHFDFARFYDWTYQGYEQDLTFYTHLAEQYGSPVLEVACGSGRVTIPLAKHGHQVVGIDFSEHMLELMQAKLENEAPDVRESISLTRADMREFNLGTTFPSVFVPNASVFHILDPESLRSCISCLYNHTAPGGIAVIDVVAPGRMSNQEIGAERLAREGVNPSTGLLTREFNRKTALDRKSRIVTVLHTYVECIDDKERSCSFEQSYRWLEKDEGLNILAAAGFEDVKIFGGYDNSPYNEDSPRLILMAERR